ncbi:MAG: patatin-like phospholipase family protein [Candidatus Paceibacterota bacterium]
MSDENTNKIEVKKYPFKGMVFEGGGSLGVAHVGGVKVFSDLGILDQIEYFVGSSAGAIIATMLACRANPDNLAGILMSTDFNKFKDDSYGIIRDSSRFMLNFGWYKGDALESWYGQILKDLTGSAHITFKEAFTKYNTHLTITVTDVNLGKTLYLNHNSSPDMMIKRAIRRSSIMPLLFRADNEIMDTKIFENGGVRVEKIKHFFTDGGLLNNYPIQYLDNILHKHEVIGFKLMSSLQLAEINIPDIQNSPNPPHNIVDYILLLYTILRNQALKIHVDELDWNRTVKIDVQQMSSTNFDLNAQDKTFLLQQGKLAAENFISTFNLLPNMIDSISAVSSRGYSNSSVYENPISISESISKSSLEKSDSFISSNSFDGASFTSSTSSSPNLTFSQNSISDHLDLHQIKTKKTKKIRRKIKKRKLPNNIISDSSSNIKAENVLVSDYLMR